ncbi:MAG: hypothetical protein ACR2GP_14040 [Burkholderiaceae bacterium]
MTRQAATGSISHATRKSLSGRFLASIKHAPWTESRAEYEAYVRVVAWFSKADTLQTLIKESIHQTKEQVAAKALLADTNPPAKALAFDNDPPEDAVKKHPELRSAFLTMKAAELYATKAIDDRAARAAFLESTRERIRATLHEGKDVPEPSTKVRDQGRER